MALLTRKKTCCCSKPKTCLLLFFVCKEAINCSSNQPFHCSINQTFKTSIKWACLQANMQSIEISFPKKWRLFAKKITNLGWSTIIKISFVCQCTLFLSWRWIKIPRRKNIEQKTIFSYWNFLLFFLLIKIQILKRKNFIFKNRHCFSSICFPIKRKKNIIWDLWTNERKTKILKSRYNFIYFLNTN